MTSTRKPLLALLLLPLPTLGSGFLDEGSPPSWVDRPSVERFSLCFNHSCKETATVGLEAAEWDSVRALFDPPPTTPEAERQRIARAIGRLEKLVGPKIGTQNDKGMNFRGSLAQGNQQDCIDESTNSTTFLTLMQQHGLLRFHRVQETSTRGWFIMGMPHTTAVIRETASGTDFAVDSWFHDNGVPPEILPVSQWRNAWYPPGSD